MNQPNLFDLSHPDTPAAPQFAGETFDASRDANRLKGLLGRVWSFMRDGQWRTLAEIQQACGGTEASCSARLRDLRKDWAGKHTIERQRVDDSGLWQYRMADRQARCGANARRADLGRVPASEGGARMKAAWQCQACGFRGQPDDEIGMGRCPCGRVLDSVDELCADPLLARVITGWPGLPLFVREVIAELMPRECV